MEGTYMDISTNLDDGASNVHYEEKRDERWKENLKKYGYGHFTYDENGKLSGVAFEPPDVDIPTTNEIA